MYEGGWSRNSVEGHTMEEVQLKYTTHEVHRKHIRMFDVKKEYAIT